MQSFFLRPIVMLLTFLVGVAITSLCFYTYLEKPKKILSPPTEENASLSAPRPVPTPVDLAEFYGYIREASIKCRNFPSALSANRALWGRVKSEGSYAKIVRRGAKRNGAGQKVGVRLITWSCCGVEGQSAAHIYWTDGLKFCDIIAATRKEALEFEKRNQ